MKPRRQIAVGAAAFYAVLATFCLIATLSAELTTAEVKARYISSFVKYVTWPAEQRPSDVLTVCVTSSDAVKTALEAVGASKKVNNASLRVLAPGMKGAEQPLHVVYTSETDRERIADFVGNVNKGTLTIGEGPHFLSRGGMIEFRLKDGKVRFAVNLRAMREAGFKVDSKFLTIAEEVIGK